MKRIYLILFTTLGLISLPSVSHAKAIMIPADAVFDSLESIQEIKVVDFVGDTVMRYMDLKTMDTLKLDCPFKPFSQATISIIKQRDTSYSSMEGTYPKIGEVITMITYRYGGKRTVFAKRQGNFYRFWNPFSIPFANTVYFISKIDTYIPTDYCLKNSTHHEQFYCSDGFKISRENFIKLSNKS